MQGFILTLILRLNNSNLLGHDVMQMHWLPRASKTVALYSRSDQVETMVAVRTIGRLVLALPEKDSL